MTFAAAAQKMMKPAAALAAAGSLGLAGNATATDFSTINPNSHILHPNGGLEQVCTDLNGMSIVYNAPARHMLYRAQVSGDVNAFSTAARFVTVTGRAPGLIFQASFSQQRGQLIPSLVGTIQAETNLTTHVPTDVVEISREVSQQAIGDVADRNFRRACTYGIMRQFDPQ